MRNPILYVGACLLSLNGCERYQPMPLTPAAVNQTLRPPSDSEMQASVTALRHPLLLPVKIDLQQGLTPDAAAILAVIANPSLRALRDQQAVSSAQLFQAGLLPNPALEFTLDPVTGGNTVGTSTGYLVGVNWEITALITHEAKVAAARAGNEAVRLDVAWQEWQTAEAAKKAVYGLLSLREQRDEAQRMDHRLAEELTLIRKAVDAHQKTLVDLAAVEAAGQKAHGDFLAAARDVRHQEAVLNLAIGLPAEAVVPLHSEGPIFRKMDLPSAKDLLDGMENRRLDLLALRRGYESQEQTLRVAVLAQFPKIVLGFHQASDTTGVHSTGFGVTIDLPIFDRNQGAIAIERATRQKLFDEYANRIHEARSAVVQALADMDSINEQIAAAEAAIPVLERLDAAYGKAVEQHNADVLSYYAAQNDLAQLRIDRLKLTQQLWDNQIALEIATGRYLRQTPATDPSTQPATLEARR